jgi:8-oxo-dGTP pyrophosphatase MutT (NUDIX family)
MSHDSTIPEGARCAARVLLLDERDHALFLHAEEPALRYRFWVMPGGGLEPGESFEEAARREVLEETGWDVLPVACLWYRAHRHQWNGRPAFQYERYFLARVPGHSPTPHALSPDGYIVGHRWWGQEDLLACRDDFAPRHIRELLPPLLRGEIPLEPFDCGI